MPVLINEVIAEVVESVTEPSEALPAPHQLPMSPAETELAQTLDLIHCRRERLAID